MSEKPKRILLVEDDAELRSIYAEGLEDYGFEVVTARDGLLAFETFVEQGPFDALVVDQDMPHLTGPELLERLRARGANAPAVLISGRTQLDPLQRAKLGIGSLFEKPFTLKSLVTALRGLLVFGS